MIRVLLVDDNDFNLFILEQIITDAGYEHFMCIDGQKALDEVKRAKEANERPYNLVFMDIHMPEPDGIKTTALIRKMYTAQELPIIGLSGESNKAILKEASNAGMNDFLSKPFKAKVLLDMIEKYA
jgi:CheY-like chemotaxis protein